MDPRLQKLIDECCSTTLLIEGQFFKVYYLDEEENTIYYCHVCGKLADTCVDMVQVILDQNNELVSSQSVWDQAQKRIGPPDDEPITCDTCDPYDPKQQLKQHMKELEEKICVGEFDDVDEHTSVRDW